MSKRAESHISKSSLFRTRATVLAAGVGVAATLGAGVAMAAEQSSGGGFTGASASVEAQAVKAQAEAQAQAATKKAEAAAKKKAEAKAAAKKKATGWGNPVKNYTLSASYAQAGGMWSSKHSGQDFAVPVGTKVAAVHNGTVVKAGPNGAGDGPAYGNAVVIKHDNGRYSQYAHLSKVGVKIGQKVKTGQEIARSGNTGNSSGPHLHFEIRTAANYGTAINPASFMRSLGVNF
ncbi:M23 family metallopeptidase [Streptomyces sp. LHD-70]|uniref:M23 family metallopeptidase n=1 Tax=Streptomyces sp. LHD-70 TaxID=3072140 RepID=UPI00280FBDCD|nr:M23 family metallopeptidase [Streptomyces sp. LHD-70]MDQ8707774.1 M23 family metallopeptidase [Streptomyces sp. LHD-70]